MTKQDKIKEEWIKLIGSIGYSIRIDQIDEDGYIRYVEPLNLNVLPDLCEKHPSRIDWERWRPLSLTGIETNNGWTKIESEDDLPKESGFVKVYFSSLEIDDCLRFDGDKFVSDWYAMCPSHWKPIVKDLLPIY